MSVVAAPDTAGASAWPLAMPKAAQATTNGNTTSCRRNDTMQAIARPNNDTLYVVAGLDLRAEPVILEAPAFDSTYVSLMAVGYDHYVNIPMSTRQGHFDEPSRILFYSSRTKGYDGEPVDGIDMVSKMSGDFVSAVYRVMPHANEPERLERNLEAMKSIRVLTLSEFRQVILITSTPVCE